MPPTGVAGQWDTRTACTRGGAAQAVVPMPVGGSALLSGGTDMRVCAYTDGSGTGMPGRIGCMGHVG